MAPSTHTLIVAHSFLLGMSILLVALRCFVRIRLVKVFGADDILMLVSLAVYITMSAFLYAGINAGIGKHTADLDTQQLIAGLMYLRFIQLSYIVVVGFIKLSIALFLLRIATEKPHRWTVYITMILSTIFVILCFFYVLFQCSPVRAAWNTTIQHAKCTNPTSFANLGYVFSAVTILVDWCYALLPVLMLWNVKMSIQMKTSVLLLLGMGIFASTAPLVRLKSVVAITDEDEILFNFMEALTWTCVEPGTGIITACMATLRPLGRYLRIDGFSSASDKRYTQRSVNASSARQLGTARELHSWNDSKIPSNNGNETRAEVDDLNGSQESIIPKGGIVKTVEFGTSTRSQDGDLESNPSR